MLKKFFCLLCLWAAVFALFSSFYPLQKPAVKAAQMSDSRFVTTVMYHNVHQSKSGEYTVSAEQLESDLDAYAAAGYTTVFPSDVLAFAKGWGDLPQKPLIITFDDGRFNSYYYGFALLKERNMKAVLNIIGAFSEFSSQSGDNSNPAYSHLTWTQIADAASSGVYEIGHHTYNMHNYRPRFGVMPVSGESDENYRSAFSADLNKLSQKLLKCCGTSPFVFAFPFGSYNQMALDVLAENGFKLLFNCSEGITSITKGSYCRPLLLNRVNRSGLTATADFIQKLADLSAR